MKKVILLFIFGLLITVASAQRFYNEIKSDKDETPLLIKELSTKGILVAVNIDSNYRLYKLDANGHILNSAAFSAGDSIWHLKAIHETSYGYLLCNQISSKTNAHKVYLNLIGLNKDLSVLFNSNQLIVDSASHEVNLDFDELNGKYVLFSTIHYQSVSVLVYFRAMQYDEMGNIQRSTIYSPIPMITSHGFIQKIQLKTDGSAIALINYSNETHQLFLDSNLNVINDIIPQDSNGMGIKTFNDNLQIINDSSVVYFNLTEDSSDNNHSCVSLFRKNGMTSNSVLFYSGNWHAQNLNSNNIALDDKNIFTAIGYGHYASPLDDYKIVVSKFDYWLNTIWEREINSSTYLFVNDMIILSDGSCLILAQQYNDSTKSDTYIIKISSGGILNAITNLNQQKQVVKVYPNPGNTSISIEGVDADEVVLTDMRGILKSLKAEGNRFDTRDLPDGIYFYQIKDKNNHVSVTGKWLKQ